MNRVLDVLIGVCAAWIFLVMAGGAILFIWHTASQGDYVFSLAMSVPLCGLLALGFILCGITRT